MIDGKDKFSNEIDGEWSAVSDCMNEASKTSFKNIKIRNWPEESRQFQNATVDFFFIKWQNLDQFFLEGSREGGMPLPSRYKTKMA